MNQRDTSLAQLSISDKVPKSVGLSDTYSCMSSAYWWYWTLCWEMTLPIGDTYIPKRIGPKTEPWGMPDAHTGTRLTSPIQRRSAGSARKRRIEANPRRRHGCRTQNERDLSAWSGRRHRTLICRAPTELCTDCSQRPSECRWPLSGELSRCSGLYGKLTETCSSLPTSWCAVAAWTEPVFLVFWKTYRGC